MDNHGKTLCWDCANYCGGCSWSEHLNHTPVKGWRAFRRDLSNKTGETIESYVVIDCPEFIRDAEEGGQYRIGERERKKAQMLHGLRTRQNEKRV